LGAAGAGSAAEHGMGGYAALLALLGENVKR